MDQLESEILELICKTCNVSTDGLGEVSVAGPLIGPNSQMDLDSLDAMEIVVVIQKKYDTRIASEKMSRKVLASLKTLADFVRENRETQ